MGNRPCVFPWPVPNLASHDLDVSRLLLDLKRCSELVNRFTGKLDARAIATDVTDGLIEQFGCAFARIWLIEPDRRALRLVASAGLYTRLDGSFARVPMGSFKVGKIAQHCIPFLSNCLPDEDWVKDRQWAIENRIQGFAGLPLMVTDQAIGVLAVFSHTAMAPEFLEVLQILSLSVTVALASALHHQTFISTANPSTTNLSEQLAARLGRQKLSLLGTEQTLAPAITHLFLQMANHLANISCHYCRLVYEADTVILEAMVSTDPRKRLNNASPHPAFQDILEIAQDLGGMLQTQLDANQTVEQVRLTLPQQMPSVSTLATPPRITCPLSEREQAVIALLVQGYRDRDIAAQLYISERTVKFHAKNILAKLGVRTRIQAVFKVMQQGWLSL